MRIGIVGCGAISQRGLLPHLTQPDIQDQVTVQAVCDPAPGRAESAAKKYGVPHWSLDLESLLAREDVDAVSIASPIGFHYEQGMAAVRAGKHLHFNKTMTTTVAEADALMEAAERGSIRIVASPGEILRPQITAIRELINGGAIGTPCWAICGGSTGNYHETEDEFRAGKDALSNVDPTWYYRKPGGGPMYDIVSYCLHALTSILGPVKRVSAMSALRIPEREYAGKMHACTIDDNTILTLDFGDGLLAAVHGTPNGGLTTGFFPKIFGNLGVIDGLLLNGKAISYPGIELAKEAEGWTGEQWVLPHVTGSHRHIEEQHVFEDVMQLVDWVRDDLPSPVTADHARHVIDIIESGYRAAETGRTQILSTSFAWPPTTGVKPLPQSTGAQKGSGVVSTETP
jgi:predicted dehydrogenase